VIETAIFQNKYALLIEYYNVLAKNPELISQDLTRIFYCCCKIISFKMKKTENKTKSTCQDRKLTTFDFPRFQESLNFSEPVAANHFIQKI
jgi:uncharacterized LabA/DUF88 family protein